MAGELDEHAGMGRDIAMKPWLAYELPGSKRHRPAHELGGDNLHMVHELDSPPAHRGGNAPRYEPEWVNHPASPVEP